MSRIRNCWLQVGWICLAMVMTVTCERKGIESDNEMIPIPPPRHTDEEIITLVFDETVDGEVYCYMVDSEGRAMYYNQESDDIFLEKTENMKPSDLRHSEVVKIWLFD